LNLAVLRRPVEKSSRLLSEIGNVVDPLALAVLACRYPGRRG